MLQIRKKRVMDKGEVVKETRLVIWARLWFYARQHLQPDGGGSAQPLEGIVRTRGSSSMLWPLLLQTES